MNVSDMVRGLATVQTSKDLERQSDELADRVELMERELEVARDLLSAALDGYIPKTSSLDELVEEVCDRSRKLGDQRPDQAELDDICSGRSPVDIAEALELYEGFSKRLGAAPLSALQVRLWRAGLIHVNATHDEVLDLFARI
jgi:hypothetical protein